MAWLSTALPQVCVCVCGGGGCGGQLTGVQDNSTKKSGLLIRGGKGYFSIDFLEFSIDN